MNLRATYMAAVIIATTFLGTPILAEHARANCTFCQIIDRKLPAKIIAENDDVIVIESIRPHYASHWLIIPKKHIENIIAG